MNKVSSVDTAPALGVISPGGMQRIQAWVPLTAATFVPIWMFPLAKAENKARAGKTGKGVARSYLAALDLLVPVEASISGVIGNETTEVTDERLKTIRDRYQLSVPYFTSADDTPGGAGKTKVDTISVQAPPIVGWVQTLLPRLPKPKDGTSTMTGLFN
ncbi:hypothetical protein NM208_g8337 [Fusarium decemcellulare]|uniref:Uncharacterized protein n=1 Tax=Fusarium decemcellulare TaxID=57161 RepID=A0ACC1S5V2_9HYPO|nr:hypothetical protein NM208_g8337 [Fusarium decemcellulare]